MLFIDTTAVRVAAAAGDVVTGAAATGGGGGGDGGGGDSRKSEQRFGGPVDKFGGVELPQLKLDRVSPNRIYYPGQSYETDDLAPRENQFMTVGVGEKKKRMAHSRCSSSHLVVVSRVAHADHQHVEAF